MILLGLTGSIGMLGRRSRRDLRRNSPLSTGWQFSSSNEALNQVITNSTLPKARSAAARRMTRSQCS